MAEPTGDSGSGNPHRDDLLPGDGLSLAPFVGARPTVDGPALADRLCPPYDVIDRTTRERLLARDDHNAVAIVLPDPTPEGYAAAGVRLAEWVAAGALVADSGPALYVYELIDSDGSVTRGLLGAVELRDPDDGVILPHENTMAGPVADRLAVMTAADADLEPIYLVYDGGGAASDLVASVGQTPADDRLVASATTADGVQHRLWCVEDAASHAAVAADLAGRHALIADGHHRYATYRERQRLRRESAGAGPWDRGLALLVDTSEYGPQVHPIHRVVAGLDLAAARAGLPNGVTVVSATDPRAALRQLSSATGFAAVLTDGDQTVVLTDPDSVLAALAYRDGEPAALAALDVTVLHRGLVERVWRLPDDVDTVGYAHDVDEAFAMARERNGLAILLRPTPVEAVADVAAAGARMPRKSTLFTPKPASGLVLRRLTDQLA